MINIIISIIFPFIFLPIILNEYYIMQCNHYEVQKYMLYEKKKKIIVTCLLFLIFLMGIFTKYKYVSLITSLIITNISFISGSKIKLTSRVKRFIIVYFTITYLLVLFKVSKINLLLIVNSFIIFYMLIVHYISSLIEKIILFNYKKDAQKIIKDIDVIGITGSYGKTSCKNILYDMLSEIVNVSKTPKSYNTKVGIIKSIRENCNSLDDYFICEYGVDKVGGMDKLLNVVKPNISLITEVGPQHLLSFKNIENIRKEKIKLGKILKENEALVINGDNKYLKASIKEFKCNVITYGIKDNEDITCKNISFNKEGSEFDLYVYNKFIKHVRIKLLGKHNVSNVLGAIGVLVGLNISLENIDKLTSNIKQIEHRLELKKLGNIKVIDDAFNSNESGFKNAIDILSMMDGYKIVITPGIIEQGKNSENINYELGKYMSDKVDLVVLVEQNAMTIKEGLISGKFDENKVFIKKDFLEAFEFVRSCDKENKIVLIENDLPRIYLK